MATSKLVFRKFGDPLHELSLEDDKIPETLQPNEAHVRFLYSPINPVDLHVIRGLYPALPTLPAIPGEEGVVEVIRGHKFQPGDHAISLKFGLGFWRQQGVVDEQFLRKVPPQLPVEAAASLIVNPCTAYMMFAKTLPLQPGDVLIQNGANSALGQIVIQLAKLSGIKTINVIRNRPNLSDTVAELKQLGADVVITNEELSKGLGQLNLGLTPPKLALECVGGHASADLAASLADGGTMIVYGRLSGQPTQINQADLLFRDIRVIGFSRYRWIHSHSKEEYEHVLEELTTHYSNGTLRLPKFHKFSLSQWKDAINFASKGFTNEKVLFQLT